MESTMSRGVPQSPIHSALLSKALNRFRVELKNDYEPIDDVASMEDLLAQTKAFEPSSSRNSKMASALSRLEPILSQINNFAAIIALASGADAKATGLVWGSLKVILKLATPAGGALDDVLNMLDKMSLSLPRFHSYEESLPMSQELESALLEVYTEMTCFCARTINFFRCHPHRPLIHLDWPKLDGDFSHTMMRIERLSKAVDVEADAIRLRADSNRNTELLAAMSLMKDNPVKDSNLPCYHLPFGFNEQFFGRDEIVQRVKEALDPQEGDFQPRSIALYGMGGVGKTQIARHYANSSRILYDAIFWVSADNPIKMAQDFLDIGQKLGLVSENGQVQDASVAMLKVKSWLAASNCRWLLVLDNADDLGVLRLAWPGSAAGSICLTSRDLASGYGVAATGIHVQPFDDLTGADTFLRLIGQSESTSDLSLAKEICHKLGGLPLALRQISGFISQQRLSLKDFIPLYERNAAKIHARKSGVTDYEHTLATCWELALCQISKSAYSLQRLLAFFDPDSVDELVLIEGSRFEDGDTFEFLTDEMDFMDAKEELLRSALIDRSPENASLSVHRLVQAAVINKMSIEERRGYFDQTLKILSAVFPNSWRSGPGYVYTAWSKCETCLPHVQFLVTQAETYNIDTSDPLGLVDLLLRCSWYLYESERFDRAQSLVKLSLSILPDKNELTFARATNLLGLTYLDVNQPEKALECFQAALKIRRALLDSDNAFIASSLSNVALAYTELNILDKSVQYQQQAINIRLRTNSELIGNSYSNMASCLLRMGKADEAEEMLWRCPSLKDMTDEAFLRSDNLRFTSDMVLLSKVRQMQGRSDDALRLASKALEFRQKTQGNRFKTCDGFYQVASLLQQRGDATLALNLLDRCMEIAKSLPDAEGYLARANFRQAEIYRSIGDDGDQERRFRDAAEDLRAKLIAKGLPKEGFDGGYDDLVPWMLW